SCPGVEPVARKYLSASAPYLSMTSIGSTPLPNDFDILRFCSSRTSPCSKTSSKGFSPVCSSEEKIILATQKKMISYPLTRTFVGKNFFTSAVFAAQPFVENGHPAVENHVSRTSASRVQFSLSSGASMPT